MRATRLLLAATLVLLAGCSSVPDLPLTPTRTTTTPVTSPASRPSTRTATATTAAKVLVAGLASADDGSAVAGVRVVFRSRSLGTALSARTGRAGTYSIDLAPEDYVVACTAPRATCSPELPGGGRTLHASRASALVDLAVTPSSSATSSSPSRTTAPPHPPRTGNDEGGGTGHVYLTDGRTVRGITIEFKRVPECPGTCRQPFTTTDSDGAYAINLGTGTYNALCVVERESYDCAVLGSHGEPYVVWVPPGNQRVDFVLCKSTQYPRCVYR